MEIYSIYKITNNITNECYIGFSVNPTKRIQNHKNLAKNLNNNKLYMAIRKYEWHNFSYEIIYQSKNKEYTLKTMEQFFIEEYDSINTGYNTKKGGDCSVFNEINEYFLTSPEDIPYKTKILKNFVDYIIWTIHISLK